MRTDRTLWLTAIFAIGAGLVVFPFLPGEWPNPLQQGVELRQDDLLQMKMAAARVDAACTRGDLRSFVKAVTSEHQRRLLRQLRTVERQLDPVTLRQLGSEREFSFAELMRRRVLASEVRGKRAAIALDRPDGVGAQVLEFVWDGRKLRLDDSHHATAATSSQSARTLVREAVSTRR